MFVAYIGKEGEFIQSHEQAPLVGEICTLGAISSVELYRGELETVCVAVCGEITHSDDETFDIQLKPDRSIINYGWSMIGRPPTGRLNNYEPTGDGDGMKATASNWRVDMVDTCTPLETGTYKAIHICHCVNVGQLAAV